MFFHLVYTRMKEHVDEIPYENVNIYMEKPNINNPYTI